MENFIQQIIGLMPEGYEITVEKRTKNNGIIYTGLMMKIPGQIVNPYVYIDPYYEEFKEGRDINSIMASILAECERSVHLQDFDPVLLQDFDQIKHRLRIRLINRKWNEGILSEWVYRELLDLAVIYAFDMGEYFRTLKEGHPVVHVTMKDLNIWRITEEDLFRTAMENMRSLADYHTVSLDKILSLLPGCRPKGNNHLLYVEDRNGDYPGTAILMDDEALSRFSKQVGGSYYILPTSVFELLLLPADLQVNPTGLKKIVEHVNEVAVRKEDWLSDQIYYYDADSEKVTIINGEETE